MWTITYFAISKQTHEVCASEAITCHPEAMQQWLAQAREPDHVAPIEMWSPLQGSPDHMIEITGSVSYWHGDSRMVDDLLVSFWHGDSRQLQPVVLERQRERFAQVVRDFPDDDYKYSLLLEQRDTKRVPRTNKRFQQALEQTVKRDDDARDD